MAIQYDFSRLTDRASLIASLGLDEFAFNRVISFVGSPSLTEQQVAEVPLLDTLEDFPEFFRHEIPKRNVNRGVSCRLGTGLQHDCLQGACSAA